MRSFPFAAPLKRLRHLASIRSFLESRPHGTRAAVGLALAVSAWSASAQQTVVANFSDSSLVIVDLSSGERTLLSNASTGTGTTFASPVGTTRDVDGSILIGEQSGTGAGPRIFRIDPTTGNRTVVSGGGVGTGDNLSGIYGLLVEPDGAIIAASYFSAAIYRINPTTGDRTVITSGTIGSGATMRLPFGMVFDPDGNIVFPASPGELIRVNPTNGNRTIISSDTTGSGPSLGAAYGIATLADGDFAVLTGSSNNYLIRVDPQSGDRTVISGASVGSGPAIGSRYSLAIDSNGYFYVADFSNASIVKIDPSTGDRVVVSSSTVGTGPNFSGPLGMLGGAVSSIVSGATPSITSTTNASGTYGTSFSYTISADHTPTSYDATGLPSGLAVDSATGAITGTPTQTGSFNVSLEATNDAGTGTATLTITVAKAALTVTASSGQSKTYGTADPTFTYSITTGALVGTDTFTGALTRATGEDAGSYPLALGTLSAGPNYTIAFVPANFAITTANATVTLGSLTTAYTGSPQSVAITTSPAGLPVTVTYNGSSTLPTAVGDYAVFATINHSNYQGSANGMFSITKAAASVSLGNLNATYNGTSHSVTVTTSPAELATLVTYSGSSAAPTAAGVYPIIATVNHPSYQGSSTGTLAIAKASQTVAFSLPTSVQIGTPVSLTATASSGLPVTFSVVSGPASIAGETLTFTETGSVVVRATQSGNGNYHAASVDRTLADITKLSQSITFPAVSNRSAADVAFTLSASASSGLPVSFSVVSGPALLSGSSLTLTGVPGTVQVRASQAGNSLYQAAADVTHAFDVTAVGPMVYFGTLGEGIQAREMAAEISTDGKFGTLIGTIPGTGEGFVVNFEVGVGGVWAAAVTPFSGSSASPSALPLAVDDDRANSRPRVAKATGATRTFRGVIEGGVLTGTIDELGLTFSANIQPPVGPTAALAGYYEAPSLNSATGSTYSVVGTQGRVYVLMITASALIGNGGSVQPNGAFSIETNHGVSIVGNVDAGSTVITGKIVLADGKTESFSGVRESTLRTDRLVNLSTRARVAANGGSGTLITGFVIGGSSPKTVLLRGVGPTLTEFGLSNVLADPRLRVFNAKAEIIAENDNWGGTAELTAAMNRVGAFALPADSKDAVLLLDLAPGAYSVHVLNGGQSGVALAEIYDASSNPQSEYQRLINISSRGLVATGDGVLIGGFAVTGNAPKRVLVRGAGPALAAYHVPGVLADPQIRLYGSSGAPVAENNDWGTPITIDAVQTSASGGEIAAANAAVGAFAFANGSKDAALVVTLAPGNYTVHLSGANGSTGVGLIEIYEITP